MVQELDKAFRPLGRVRFTDARAHPCRQAPVLQTSTLARNRENGRREIVGYPGHPFNLRPWQGDLFEHRGGRAGETEYGRRRVGAYFGRVPQARAER